jgi:molybdate transport system substrate-binding protein
MSSYNFPMRKWIAIVGSLVAVAAIVGLLAQRNHRPNTVSRPLIVYAAAALRPPMEQIAQDFQASTGRTVELHYGASEDLLTRVALPNASAPADLFLPADDTYVTLAEEKRLVAASWPVVKMHAVVLLPPGNPAKIAAWSDLIKPNSKVALGNPGTAIGKQTRVGLLANGSWYELAPRVIDTGTVTESANAAKIGSVNAAIVWDGVAKQYANQTFLELPELDGIIGRVKMATLNQSGQKELAEEFARFVRLSPRWRERGYE